MEEKMMVKRIDLKKIKATDVLGWVGAWWGKAYRVVFILCMFVSMAASIFAWYKGISLSAMTKQEADEYRAVKSRSVKFNEEHYSDILRYIESRAAEYSAEVNVQKNIFK